MLKEDVGVKDIIDIEDPKVVGITNNLETYKNEGLHYISVILLVKDFLREPKVMEPERIWVGS